MLCRNCTIGRASVRYGHMKALHATKFLVTSFHSADNYRVIFDLKFTNLSFEIFHTRIQMT